MKAAGNRETGVLNEFSPMDTNISHADSWERARKLGAKVKG